MNTYLKPDKTQQNSTNNFVVNNSNSWFFYVVLIVITIFYVLTLRSGHYWVGDDLQYIRHAINLVEGKPYIDPLYINNSIATVSPAVYPPVFPFILSVIYALFGVNFVAMKMMLIGFFISSLVVLKMILEKHISSTLIISVALFLGVNPELWEFKDRILSEFPFLFFALLTLLLMQLNDVKRTYVYAIFLGITMYFSYGIREIALVLPLTLITYELWHYRKISTYTMITIGLFALLVTTQKLALGASSTPPDLTQQLDLMMESGSTIPNTFSYINISPENIFKQGERYFWSTYRILQIKHLPYSGHLYLFVNILVLTGYLSLLFKKVRVTEIYFMGYLCALLLFAGFEGFRYLLPILPFYFLYLVIGFLKLISALPSLLKYALSALILAIVFVNFTGFLNKETSLLEVNKRSPKIDQLHSYVSDHTHKTDVLVCINPRVVSFFTQRPASTYPFSKGDPEWFMNYLRAIKARYLITEIDISTKSLHKKQEIDLLFDKYPDRFIQVFNNSSFQVYHITNNTL